MSQSDSFIDEVTEEVRRDRLFALMRRYGWIAVLLVIVIVGGAAFNEWRKTQARAQAEGLGDAILAAMDNDTPAARAASLDAIDAQSAGGRAVVGFLQSAAQADADNQQQAVDSLAAIASNGELPEIYRQIAAFKALTLQGETLPAQDRRLQFDALAQAGSPLRLLAQEQLALIDIEQGDTDAALTRLQSIREDAGASRVLQQRVAQVIVALGGTLTVQQQG